MNENNRFVKITAKYSGPCKECGEQIQAGETALWDARDRVIFCSLCAEDLEQ